MVNKLNIMGVQLSLETADKMISRIDEFLENAEMNTIVAVSMRMLMLAQKDTEFKNIINGYDVALPGEVEILTQANIKEQKLYHEIKENSFFEQFMKRLAEKEKKVYLLAETEEQSEELAKYISSYYKNVNIAGNGCVNDGGEIAALINRINIVAPDVILSTLASPNQEWFIRDRRSMLDARVWYGMNDRYRLRTPSRRVRAKMLSILRQLNLKGFMARYHKENDEK